MYGFIEKWLADLIGVQYEPYTLNDGGEAALLERMSFETVKSALRDIWSRDHDNEHLEPQTIRCDIVGTKVLFHKYWVNDNILHSLTGAETKNTNAYIYLMNTSIPRFSIDQFTIDIRDAYNERINGRSILNRETIEDATVLHEDDIQAEQAVEETDPILDLEPESIQKPEPEPEISIGEKYILKINNVIPRMIVRGPLKTINGKTVAFALGEPFTDNLSIMELADTIDRNIIVVKAPLKQSYINMIKKIEKFSDVKNHTIFLLTYPDENTGFSVSEGSLKYDNVCFGESIKRLHLIRSKDKESVKKSIINDESMSADEREKVIKELDEKPELSVYSKFDKVFKDTKTNVVWALVDRCFVYMTFDPSYTPNQNAYKKCMKELGRRFHGNISKAEILKIDNEYHQQISEKDKNKYVQFVVDGSQSLIKTLKDKFQEEKKLYEEFLNKAMEHGKLMNKYANYIESFDPEASEKKERDRALKAYEETIQIPGVLSININNDIVNVYTKNLYAQDERTKKWHDVGTFHIRIGMVSDGYHKDDTVKIMNTKHQVTGMNAGMQAPHVFSEGHICHGSLARGMVEAYKNRDLFQLVYQLILFLQQANTDDSAGKYVNKWPEVSDEIANNGYGIDELVEEETEAKIEPTEEELEFDRVLASAIPVNI